MLNNFCRRPCDEKYWGCTSPEDSMLSSLWQYILRTSSREVRFEDYNVKDAIICVPSHASFVRMDAEFVFLILMYEQPDPIKCHYISSSWHHRNPAKINSPFLFHRPTTNLARSKSSRPATLQFGNVLHCGNRAEIRIWIARAFLYTPTQVPSKT